MFIVSEYAACFLLVIMVSAVFLTACGIGYMLKSAASLLARFFREVRTPALVPVVATSTNGNHAYARADRDAVVDCLS